MALERNRVKSDFLMVVFAGRFHRQRSIKTWRLLEENL